MHRSSNIYLKFLFCTAKLWGLAPFTLKNGQLCDGPFRVLLYPSILVSVVVSYGCINYGRTLRSNAVQESAIVVAAGVVSVETKVLGTVLSLLVFIVKRKEFVSLVSSLTKVDASLRKLGIIRSQNADFKRRAIRVAAVGFVIFSTDYVTTLIQWIDADELRRLRVTGDFIVGNVVFFVKHAYIIIFVNVVDVVRIIFDQINERLLNVCRPVINTGRVSKGCTFIESITELHIDDEEANLDVTTLSEENLKPSKALKKLAELHDSLRDVFDRAMQLLSLPLIVILAHYLASLVAITFYSFVLIEHLLAAVQFQLVYGLISVILAVIVISFELFSIAMVCSRMQKTVNSTSIKLHKMRLKYQPIELDNESRLSESSRCISARWVIITPKHRQYSSERDAIKYNNSTSIENMNDRSNVYPTILYNLAKVWGLAPFSMRRNIVSEGSVRNLIVPSIIVIICVPIAIMTVFGPNADFVGDTTVTMVSDTLSSQANIASIMVTLGTFMVKRKQIVTVIRSFLAADRTLKRLGIERDYREQFQRITIYVFVSCGFTFILEIGSGCFFWFTLDAESRPWAICSMFVADIVTFVKHLAVQIFLVAVRITDERFGHVNDLLSKLCSSRSKNSPLDLDRPEVGNLSREIPKPSEKLKMIEELFNDVTDSAEKTVQLFSLPLCVIIANNFMNITVTCYYVYVATTNLDPSDASMATVQVLATISWALVKVVETIAIAVICDSAQNTANSAARFLHKMWIQDRPTHMRDEIQMLSLQLLHRPLQISAFGFFALDYSYLYKIFCAVAAYFVIMVQLDSARAS